jgi:hypothetical protein
MFDGERVWNGPTLHAMGATAEAEFPWPLAACCPTLAQNVMWRYREQRSFGYTEQEYMERLDMFARVLVRTAGSAV